LLLGLSLLIDGLYIAVVASGGSGTIAPARYLAVLNVIAVALLASFRTGLKLALWHTLLLHIDQQLRSAGLLERPAAPLRDVIVFVAVLWAVTLSTASFAAVNERELRRRGYDLDALARLTLQLDMLSEPAAVAVATVRTVADDFVLPRVVLVGVSDTGAEVLASHGEVLDVGLEPDGDEMVELALASRSTLLIKAPDPERDPWLAASLPGAVNVGLISLHADGQPLGVLVFEHGLRRGSRIEQRVVTMLERFAAHASLSLANARLLAQVYALATTDALTGLVNRRVFEARMDVAIATGRPVSVVLVDIDHFKQVNDVHGHPTGDTVLRDVACALRELSRPADVVARYGGEEFAVLMPDTDALRAHAFAERLRLGVRTINGPVPVTASLGVASWPEHAEHPAKLLAGADAALYASKRGGRDRTTNFRDLADMDALAA
jgi:diguanylate cyclase (GGDEF)-like protein